MLTKNKERKFELCGNFIAYFLFTLFVNKNNVGFYIKFSRIHVHFIYYSRKNWQCCLVLLCIVCVCSIQLKLKLKLFECCYSKEELGVLSLISDFVSWQITNSDYLNNWYQKTYQFKRKRKTNCKYAQTKMQTIASSRIQNIRNTRHKPFIAAKHSSTAENRIELTFLLNQFFVKLNCQSSEGKKSHEN